MTKKHFIKLADTIKANKIRVPFTHDQLTVLAIFCKSVNPNFKQERWFDYIAGNCGPNGGKIKQTLDKK